MHLTCCKNIHDEQFRAALSKLFLPPNRQPWVKLLIWKWRIMVGLIKQRGSFRDGGCWARYHRMKAIYVQGKIHTVGKLMGMHWQQSTFLLSNSAEQRSWYQNCPIPFRHGDLGYSQCQCTGALDAHELEWDQTKKTATITTAAWAGIPPNDYGAIWCSLSTNGGIHFVGKAVDSAQSQKLVIEWRGVLRCGSLGYPALLFLLSATLKKNFFIERQQMDQREGLSRKVHSPADNKIIFRGNDRYILLKPLFSPWSLIYIFLQDCLL